MNTFVVVTGSLLFGVLAFLLRPLLSRAGEETEGARGRRINLAVLREQKADLEQQLTSGQIDQAAYDLGCQELEQRTLEDVGESAQAEAVAPGRRTPGLALAFAGLLSAAVVALYLGIGEPAVLSGGKTKGAADGSHALSQEQILGMVEKLAEKLQANPNDGAGWLMLARSYAVLGRFPESAAAYGRAAGLMPPDAQMLADFADTVAMVQGRRLQGEPEKLIRRALEIDPKNLKALALQGTLYFERQDYLSAIGEWQKVLALVPPESNVASGIQGSIRDAENRLATAGGAAVKVAAGTAVAVTGLVALDPSLAGKFAPTDTVFVFARAAQGPKMPLAMLRRTVADLPLRFTLDDGMAMAPNLRLSQYDRIVVGARVSRQGDALPRPGDWQGLSEVMAPGSRDVKILVNSLIE